MNKSTRNRLLALAKVFDGWAQRIRAKVKAGTPKRARRQDHLTGGLGVLPRRSPLVDAPASSDRASREAEARP